MVVSFVIVVENFILRYYIIDTSNNIETVLVVTFLNSHRAHDLGYSTCHQWSEEHSDLRYKRSLLGVRRSFTFIDRDNVDHVARKLKKIKESM